MKEKPETPEEFGDKCASKEACIEHGIFAGSGLGICECEYCNVYENYLQDFAKGYFNGEIYQKPLNGLEQVELLKKLHGVK